MFTITEFEPLKYASNTQSACLHKYLQTHRTAVMETQIFCDRTDENSKTILVT